MTVEIIDWMPEDIWSQLAYIAEATDQAPSDVAVDILREGVRVKLTDIAEQVDADVFRLEAELTAARARQAGLNGPSEAPQSPVEPSNDSGPYHWPENIRRDVRAVLGADRSRTFTTREVIDELVASGYNIRGNVGFYGQVNRALCLLVKNGEARRAVHGQYAWRRRPNKA